MAYETIAKRTFPKSLPFGKALRFLATGVTIREAALTDASAQIPAPA